MDQLIKKFTEIDYDKDNVIEQQTKRCKYMQQGLLDNIASSIETTALSVKSIGENHTEFLKVNRLLTSYLLEIEKKTKEQNLAKAKSSTSSVQGDNRSESISSDLSK